MKKQCALLLALLSAISAPLVRGEGSVSTVADSQRSATVERAGGGEAAGGEDAEDAGKLSSSLVQLDKLQVQGKQESFDNAIDRKIYQVGKDIQSATGSASDLLQNVPAVQVDIEGNVSLRGSTNVTILIDGKSSTLMARNRAAALEQMGADGIETIEVITNPSAKYRPDGTAGIINIVTKKKRKSTAAASVRANVGTDSRYNVSVSGSVPVGATTFHGTAGVRQDDRPRELSETRNYPNPATGVATTTTQHTDETSRPLSRIIQGGFEFTPHEGTTLGAYANYNYRDFLRRARQRYTTGAGGSITGDYQRVRYDPEYEESLEFGGTLAHTFAEDRELNLEVKHGQTDEQEDNHYVNTYVLPAVATSADNTLIKVREESTEATADYTSPLGKDAKLETGYAGLFEGSDADFQVSKRDPASGVFVPDLTRTNRFKYDSKIHAIYATYQQHWGNFGAMGGLRFEDAQVDTHQITTGQEGSEHYDDLYPTLHLTYDLPRAQQLQLNYSHRVRRPEGDDLNPFPEYQDPFSLRAGNPHLQPEQIHSVEGGWQLKDNDTTYLATVYYRYRYNVMTEVTKFIDATTLLTTKENLATSDAGGVELGLAHKWWDKLAVNFSGNIYRSQIDAGNLGFTEARSATAWDAKVNVGWEITPATLVQFNANYTAKRLTPQGYRYPTSVFNVGLRHTFKNKKTALVVTISDLFNSLSERTLIDTPELHDEIVRRRSSRIVYVGFIYNFNHQGKAQKNDIQFDNAP